MAVKRGFPVGVARLPDPNIVYLPVHYVPELDIASKGVQGPDGVWRDGTQRSRRRCRVCRGRPDPRGYCDSCKRSGPLYRGPWSIQGPPAREFLKPTVKGPEPTPAEALAAKLGRKPTRRELRRLRQSPSAGTCRT